MQTVSVLNSKSSSQFHIFLPLSSFPFSPLSTLLLSPIFSLLHLSPLSIIFLLPSPSSFLTLSLSFFTHLDLLPSLNQDGPNLVKKVKGSFLFKVTASDGTVHEWLVDLKKGSGSVTKAPGEERPVLQSPQFHAQQHEYGLPRLWEIYRKPPKYGILDMQCGLHGVCTRGRVSTIPTTIARPYKAKMVHFPAWLQDPYPAAINESWPGAWAGAYWFSQLSCLVLFLPFPPPGKKGDCTVSIKDADFMDLVSGKLGPQKVYLYACINYNNIHIYVHIYMWQSWVEILLRNLIASLHLKRSSAELP